MVRGWVLGVIAAFAALPALARDELKDPTGALAAETTLLPCPSQGAGFARTPGSRTCFRISGRVVTGVDLRANGGTAAAPTTAGRIAIDTRTDSDVGPVRTYVRIGQGRR